MSPDAVPGPISQNELETGRRLGACEPAAVSVVYDRDARLAYSLAHRICGPQQAENALAAAFVELVRECAAAVSEDSISTRLLRITRDCGLNRVSDRRHSDRRALRTDATGKQLVSADERACIDLAYFDGLTVGEIARCRDMSSSAVKHVLYTGLTKASRSGRTASPPI